MPSPSRSHTDTQLRTRLLYHVPRSQVWKNSVGGQSGNVHIHVTAPFVLGRIRRDAGNALCGKRGWYERHPYEVEIAAGLCPRCENIEARALAALRKENDA